MWDLLATATRILNTSRNEIARRMRLGCRFVVTVRQPNHLLWSYRRQGKMVRLWDARLPDLLFHRSFGDG